MCSLYPCSLNIMYFSWFSVLFEPMNGIIAYMSKHLNIMMTSDENLMMMFDASFNPGVNPDSITIGSTKKLNWRCIHDNRHVFSMSPLNLVNQGYRCPACLGNICITGVNDIATEHPRLARLFDSNANNVKPSMITSHGRASTVRDEHGRKINPSWILMVVSIVQEGRFLRVSMMSPRCILN